MIGDLEMDYMADISTSQNPRVQALLAPLRQAMESGVNKTVKQITFLEDIHQGERMQELAYTLFNRPEGKEFLDLLSSRYTERGGANIEGPHYQSHVVFADGYMECIRDIRKFLRFRKTQLEVLNVSPAKEKAKNE